MTVTIESEAEAKAAAAALPRVRRDARLILLAAIAAWERRRR